MELQDKIQSGLELYEAHSSDDKLAIEHLAKEAEKLARKTEQQGREEDWAYMAAQTFYGCDWEWVEDEDEPTARVFDCDGTTIERLRPGDQVWYWDKRRELWVR